MSILKVGSTTIILTIQLKQQNRHKTYFNRWEKL